MVNVNWKTGDWFLLCYFCSIILITLYAFYLDKKNKEIHILIVFYSLLMLTLIFMFGFQDMLSIIKFLINEVIKIF